MKDKIRLISNTVGELTINLPDLHFTRTFAHKGSTLDVTKEILEEMNYDEGCRYCFKEGMIIIDDFEAKKELGLEPDDATQPENIIILTDKEREDLLNEKILWKFKKAVDSLGYEERQNLACYAIEHEILPNMDKCEYIKQACGKDIVNAIRLNRADKQS